MPAWLIFRLRAGIGQWNNKIVSIIYVLNTDAFIKARGTVKCKPCVFTLSWRLCMDCLPYCRKLRYNCNVGNI